LSPVKYTAAVKSVSKINTDSVSDNNHSHSAWLATGWLKSALSVY